MKCNVCGTVYNGNFCPGCGTPAAKNFSASEAFTNSAAKLKNKKPFYKKWWFWVIIAVTVIGIISSSVNDTETSNDINDPSSSSEQTEDKQNERITVKSISNFKTEEYNLQTGDSVELSTKVKPKNITNEDIVVTSSDSAVIEITEITVIDSRITFNCNALAAGSATVKVSSVDESVVSNIVTFAVEQAPKIKAIGKFRISSALCEVGDTVNISLYMTPSGITKDDFSITNTDSSVIGISNIQVNDDGDKTLLTFTASALKAGGAEISVVSADEKTESNAIHFTVREKDTSPTVYVTPYGDHYHYSASCAGKNASSTTLNKAKSRGFAACSKCAK